jgi:hypothetical protein
MARAAKSAPLDEELAPMATRARASGLAVHALATATPAVNPTVTG